MSKLFATLVASLFAASISFPVSAQEPKKAADAPKADAKVAAEMAKAKKAKDAADAKEAKAAADAKKAEAAKGGDAKTGKKTKIGSSSGDKTTEVKK